MAKNGTYFLEIMEETESLTAWIYEEIKPYLKGRILEGGSGIGTYSKKIFRDFKNKKNDRSKIIFSDISQNYLKHLKANFGECLVLKLNLSKKSDFLQLQQKVDSVVALNVLEHIEDDLASLKNVYEILAPGGRFILLVPAHQFLFNSLDKSVEHYRRYDKKEIVQKSKKAGFEIEKIFYYNFFGIFGWYINGNLLKKEKINHSLMKLFNLLVPFFRFFEKNILRSSVGVSLMVILKKKKA